MYFIQKNSEVVYWNAGNKLRFMKKEKEKKEKTTYKERKKLSILVTDSIIKEFYPEHDFTKKKKKDDLADCFLQLIDYLVKKGEINENIYKNAINIKL
jgi:DNA polymerase III epsilon subunit-like protein